LHDSTSLSITSGATWDLNGYAETVGSIAGAGNILLGGATLTAGGNNSSTTFSGVISETGGLTKIGTGAFTLSGSNTFTGNVNINAGTLNLNSTGRLFVVGTWDAHGIVTVGVNATLQLYDFTASTGSLGYLSYNDNHLVINGGTLEFTGTNGVMGESAANDGANKRAFTVGAYGATLLNNTANTWSIWQDTNTSYYNPVYNGDLTFDGSGDFSFNDVIDGTTAITKNGTGSVTLTQINTYTGTTSILAGSLIVSGQLGSGSYAANIILMAL
jgi:fibronectin-binding autotransporter adhesin